MTGVDVTLALPTLSGVIAGSLPPEQAGVGTGLQATTREFGSAIGVAVIGTVLNGRFASAYPGRTVAQALATGGHRAVVAAFTSAADTGLRVVGLAVLVLGALVVLESRRSRPTLSVAPSVIVRQQP